MIKDVVSEEKNAMNKSKDADAVSDSKLDASAASPKDTTIHQSLSQLAEKKVVEDPISLQDKEKKDINVEADLTTPSKTTVADNTDGKKELEKDPPSIDKNPSKVKESEASDKPIVANKPLSLSKIITPPPPAEQEDRNSNVKSSQTNVDDSIQ